ncbi:MAG TPA: cytochrome ubiquinol oxidase subunit I [Longimicrobiales bacterium]|nr:cytochrome ubiquinol oxidase subunit I [Longimicrobiales bacterium]
MTDLFAARSQMAVSLAFHIVFAAIGIGMPLLMVLSEAIWLRTRDAVWLDITHAWARGVAVFFAVGAVSGTVLSFELGLLWPGFMEYAGAIVGMPFSLEGFAFFTEAIFLGIYLYGWNRVSPRAHWWAGVAVAVSGAASALFVLAVNGWMNAPLGFEHTPGGPVSIDPVAAMLNPYWITNTVHMLIAAFMATAFGAAGIHALMLLRDPAHPFHRRALGLCLVVGGVAAVAQPLSGDVTARIVAEQQPAKFAAMEGHFETQACAPLRIGGWPDLERRETRYALEIPCGLSFLATHDPNAVIVGLNDFPADEVPDTRVVHIAFQVMVACAMAMLALGLFAGFHALRHRTLPIQPWFLRALVLAAPLGFIAIEAGWVVTEVGRQPWIIYGIMRTADAVTPMPGLVVPFTVFTLLYVLLSVVVVVVMRRQVLATRDVGTR